MINNECKWNRVGAGQSSSARLAICCVIFAILSYILLAGAEPVPAYPGTESHESRYEQATLLSDKGVIVGRASWYEPSSTGHRTATGERLDPRQLTAASTQLPLGSHALVTNLENGRSVRVRINDCGPYASDRKLDLSKRAAERLDMVHSGTAPVRIKLINMPPNAEYCPREPVSVRRKAHSHLRSSYRYNRSGAK